MRLTSDPFRFNLRLASGALGYRIVHAFIFNRLAAGPGRELRPAGPCPHGRRLCLLQNARVDEAFVSRPCHRLPEGDSELYSHPFSGRP